MRPVHTIQKGHLAHVPLLALLILAACGDPELLPPVAGPDDVALATDGALSVDATPDAEDTDAAADPDGATTPDVDAAQADTPDVAISDADAAAPDAEDSTANDGELPDALNPDTSDTADADAADPDTAVSPDVAPDLGLADAEDAAVDASPADADSGADTEVSTDADAVDGGSGPGPVLACDADHPCTVGVCDPLAHVCVGCVTTFDCATGEACQEHACVAAAWCNSDIACKATQQVCDVDSGACVDCLTPSDCGDAQVCAGHKCVDAPSCKSSKDCAAVCDVTAGVCVGCLKDTDCAANAYCGGDYQCKPDLCTGAACAGDQVFVCLANGSGFAPATSCDDALSCTTDVCAVGEGCVHLANSATCSDGSACTEADVCADGQCSGTPVDCADDNTCTLDSCSATDGCSHAPAPGPCDDGLPCTAGDDCAGGLCIGTTASCDDGMACTADSCDLASGCTHTATETASCSDGDACTGGDHCAAGLCASTGTLGCDDLDPCTSDSCAVDSGCIHTAAAVTPCDDGSLCTEDDACAEGKCVGSSVACDDGDLCTQNDCDAGAGCLYPAIACDDGNPCTDDDCDLAVGCTATANGAPCDDGDLCTTSDSCVASACSGAGALNCDDANACTLDLCAATGCTHSAVTDGTACGTFDGCSGAICSQGSCDASGSLLWEKQISTSASEQFYAVAGTADGGFAMVGGQTVTGKSVQGWVVKVDASGQSLWSRADGGSGEDRFHAVVAQADGSVVTVGNRGTQSAGQDGWLVSYDAAGTLITESTWGGSGNDSLRALAPLAGGGWILAGTQTTTQAPFGASADGWLLRLDAAGNTVFSKTYGTGQWSDGLYGVVDNGDGTVTAVGTQWIGSSISTGWFLTVDGNGDVVHSRSYLIGASQELRAVTAVPGGYALAGWITPGGNSGTNAWLHLVNATGVETSHRTWDKGSATYFYSISPVPSGGLLLSGQYQGGGSPTAWIVRTDADGNLGWSKTWGGSNTDATQAVQVQSDNTAVIAGYWGASSSSYDGYVRRIDLFGNASCDASGGCLQKGADDCNDANPCTYDTCSGGDCGHDELSDGTVCGNGLVCNDGACVND